MGKEFKNIVVINLGHLYEASLEEELSIVNEEFTRHKWFNYVVSDGVIDSLRSVLKTPSIDKGQLKRIIYDDVVSTRNVVYSSVSEEDAINEAAKISENNLVLELT